MRNKVSLNGVRRHRVCFRGGMFAEGALNDFLENQLETFAFLPKCRDGRRR